MSSKNKKSGDEIYCASCGKVIKKKAEICPECGVANKNRQIPSSTSESTNQSNTHKDNSQSSSSPHDPSNYETNVSDSWWYGVVASIVLWAVGFALPESSAVAGLFILIAWILMPLSVYHDRQRVEATTRWKPDLNIWLIITSVPLFNLVSGSVYLFRRYNSKQVSSPNVSTKSNNVNNNSAVDDVHQQYINDELSEEQLEAELEEAVKTQENNNLEQSTNSK